MDSSTYDLINSISKLKGCLVCFYYYNIREFSLFNANSVDHDQTPQNVVSDLGLCCLPMSFLWDAILKWVKI